MIYRSPSIYLPPDHVNTAGILATASRLYLLGGNVRISTGLHETVVDKLQNPFAFFFECILVLMRNCCGQMNSGTPNPQGSTPV